MKKQLLGMIALGAACLTLGVQAQTAPGSPGTSPGNPGSPGSPGSPGTSPGSPGSSTTAPGSPGSAGQYRDASGALGATGRMMGQSLRASKIVNADVKSTTGQSIGKIEDVLINPMSGRIDFAVVSKSDSTGASAATTPGTSPTATTPGSTSSSGNLVPIPWSFLRSSGLSGHSATTSTTPGSTGSDQPVSFVFNGEKNRLDSAPSFDKSNWPDVSQPDWRQRIYSHFGMQPGSATGGATSPGGTSSSSSTDPGSSPSPGSPTSPGSPGSPGSPSSPGSPGSPRNPSGTPQ